MGDLPTQRPFRTGPRGPISGLTGIEVANIAGFVVWIIACLLTPAHAAVVIGANRVLLVYFLAALAFALIAITLAAWAIHRATVTQTALILCAVFWCFTGIRFVAGGYQVIGVGMQFVMAVGSLRSALA